MLSMVSIVIMESKGELTIRLTIGFRCHPNYMNWVRLNYIKIFMQLADSDILQDIVSQIRGVPTVVNKVTNDLSKYIAKSNYMLS